MQSSMALVVDAYAGAGETYDEEGPERDHHEIEELIEEFMDKPSFRHDQIYESDDEEEKASRTFLMSSLFTDLLRDPIVALGPFQQISTVNLSFSSEPTQPSSFLTDCFTSYFLVTSSGHSTKMNFPDINMEGDSNRERQISKDDTLIREEENIPMRSFEEIILRGRMLPPLDSLLYIEDPKPNAGFNSQFDPTSFEEFSENIEGNNTISSDTIYSSSHVAARNNDSVSSNERCQKRTLKKSNTVTKDKLEMAEIKKFFDRPIKNAAKELNVGLTVLKKRCRELGIHRWPHRKLKSLNSLIGNLKGVGMEEEVKNLEEHRILIKQEPDAELTDGTKKLRQACL
ncbi:hypothetical protein HID58_005250, partial [Brassica napus]